MNWTGGHLSRHSGAAKGALGRQKQHFAKVHQKLRNGLNKKSPVKWSVFDSIIEADSGNSSRAPIPVESQGGKRGEPSNVGQMHDMNEDCWQVAVPRRIGRSVATTRTRHSRSHTKRERSLSSDNDLHKSSSPLRERKRIQTKPQNKAVESGEQLEISSSDKRRQLLRRGDWIGIHGGGVEPAPLKFVKPICDENIGRRRRITTEHKASYASRQSHITSPFPSKQHTRMGHPPASQIPGMRGRHNLRISIGGKPVPLGFSSSSKRPTKSTSSGMTHLSYQPRGVSSDIMLLDEDQSISRKSGTKIYYYIDPDLIKQSASRQSPREHIHRVAQASKSQYPLSESQVAIKWAWWDEKMKEDDQFTNGVHAHGWQKKHYSSAEREISSVSCRSETLSAAPDSSIMRPHIFSSSSASIQHPIPRSSKRFSLLSSCPSEIAETTAAQVGNENPVVPSSQSLENEMWRTWAMSPNNESEEQARDSNGGLNGEALITFFSPGVSETTARQVRKVALGKHANQDALSTLRSKDLFKEDTAHIACPQLGLLQVGEFNGLPVRPVDLVNEIEKAGTKDELPQSRFATVSAPKPSASLPKLTRNREENLEDTWRKFVFGSEHNGTLREIGNSSLINSSIKSVDTEQSFNLSTMAQPSDNGATASQTSKITNTPSLTSSYETTDVNETS